MAKKVIIIRKRTLIYTKYLLITVLGTNFEAKVRVRIKLCIRRCAKFKKQPSALL